MIGLVVISISCRDKLFVIFIKEFESKIQSNQKQDEKT